MAVGELFVVGWSPPVVVGDVGVSFVKLARRFRFFGSFFAVADAVNASIKMSLSCSTAAVK